MPVSQKDIALKIGVDRTLVAHALRGDPRVAEATRRRVEEVAAEMGYNSYSNMAARSLSGRRLGRRPKTGMIGVLSGPQFENVPVLEVPFMKSLMQGIEREAMRQELDIVLSISNKRPVPRFIEEQSVDGVICLHQWPDGMRVIQAQLELPVLRVGDYAPGEWTLTVREKQGMQEITAFLIAQGHRRIAYLGDVRDGNADMCAADKYEGFVAAMNEAGIAVDPGLVDLKLLAPMICRGEAGMERLLERTRDFTAIVCQNDSIAMGVLNTARCHGLSVPEDFSLAGFDNVTEHYGCQPLLTSVGYDRIAMGQRAVQMIYENLEFPAEGENRVSESFPTQVVHYGSVQPCSRPAVKQVTKACNKQGDLS